MYLLIIQACYSCEANKAVQNEVELPKQYCEIFQTNRSHMMPSPQIGNREYCMEGGTALECSYFIQNCPVTTWTIRQYRMKIYQNESDSKQVKNKVYVDSKYRNAVYRILILAPSLLAKLLLAWRSCLESLLSTTVIMVSIGKLVTETYFCYRT